MHRYICVYIYRIFMYIHNLVTKIKQEFCSAYLFELLFFFTLVVC